MPNRADPDAGPGLTGLRPETVAPWVAGYCNNIGQPDYYDWIRSPAVEEVAPCRTANWLRRNCDDLNCFRDLFHYEINQYQK